MNTGLIATTSNDRRTSEDYWINVSDMIIDYTISLYTRYITYHLFF